MHGRCHDGLVGANRTRAMRWHSCMAGGRWPQSADDGARPGQLIIDDLQRGGRCIGAVRGRASNKPGLWIFICSLALHWHDRLGRGGWRNNLCMLLSAIYRFKKNIRFKKLSAIYVGIKASCRREKSIVRWSLMLYFQRQRQHRRRSYAWQSAHDEA